MKKLNSTGSLWTDGENYFSYNQQLTITYKGYRLFDSGFYSMTTRKHQADIRKYFFNSMLDLKYADFNYGAEYSIDKELQGIDYELEQLDKKRNTQKKKDTIKELITKKELLVCLLHKKVS